MWVFLKVRRNYLLFRRLFFVDDFVGWLDFKRACEVSPRFSNGFNFFFVSVSMAYAFDFYMFVFGHNVNDVALAKRFI